MLTILLPFLRKLWPYVAIAGFCFTGGCAAGYRFEIGAVDAAKLALAIQQKNDVEAVAVENAAAASEIIARDAKANTAAAGFAAANAQAGQWQTVLTGQIAAQTALPGKDAPDAPVLSAALDEIMKGQR
jgi:hypothetical protein